jgi:signal transduction histidine kinase
LRRLVPPGRSLAFYSLLSWLVPAVAAASVCAFVFLATTAIQFRSERSRLESKLFEDSNTIARRISAELLLGPRGSSTSVAASLKEDFGLRKVEVHAGAPPCGQNTEACVTRAGSQLNAFRSVPLAPSPHFIVLERTGPSLWAFLKISTLLWSAIPIALMLALGIFFQRLVLRSYMLRPVQALVETSTGDKEPRHHWPREIREIADRLTESFERRDEAVFSQIARGVVHDLRTLIQSPLAATELAIDSKEDPARRLKRLENLESVCAVQLPKMREIIDTTLDGSRDIPVTPQERSVVHAIKGASRTLEPLLARTGAALEFNGATDSFVVMHDAVQLERVVTNLLKNGIEAAITRPDRPRRVSIRVEDLADKVIIEVEDSGPGLRVAPDRLFRPLKSTKPHGSGLGLVVSRKIIAAHGGALVPGRSELLGGAKFSIVLPRAVEVT